MPYRLSRRELRGRWLAETVHPGERLTQKGQEHLITSRLKPGFPRILFVPREMKSGP